MKIRREKLLPGRISVFSVWPIHFERIYEDFYAWYDSDVIWDNHYEIVVIGTGWEIEGNWEHHGTYVSENYEWHVIYRMVKDE